MTENGVAVYDSLAAALAFCAESAGSVSNSAESAAAGTAGGADNAAGGADAKPRRPVKIVRASRVYGGDINRSYLLELEGGLRVFMKTNAKENLGFFTAEAAGLSALSACGKIGTARVLCAGTDPHEYGGCSFLLLEYIESAGRAGGYWETFGRELAALHRADCAPFAAGGGYGFLQDNYIGASPQLNTPCASWIEFFRSRRLEVQIRRAAHFFDRAFLSRITRLLDHLDEFLTEPPFPSLLHGDLWGGNVMTGADGKAMLIDPAAYVGHFEADLAMTELFGGFPPAFYATYRAANPPQPDYGRRRNLYNLYHLLNHLNLFGASYLSSVRSVTAEYV